MGVGDEREGRVRGGGKAPSARPARLAPLARLGCLAHPPHAVRRVPIARRAPAECRLPAGRPKDKMELYEAFKSMDFDRNGTLSIGEWAGGLTVS